jgi:hypothetical protein
VCGNDSEVCVISGERKWSLSLGFLEAFSDYLRGVSTQGPRPLCIIQEPLCD